MASGILNVDKPSGRTSHDVVERVRALTGIRRVGHAGTLDPLATGVLLVCVGRPATRVVEYLIDETKEYRTDAWLGATTDTFDAEGKVVSERPVEVGRDAVEQALTRFRGPIQQIPPMYSAVKYRGKPLYRLARRGVEVEREPRGVHIYRLQLVLWDPPQLTLEMSCSPGTYVRVLVHDLGQELGCGAHVTSLTRLASGSFRLEDAVTLDTFAERARHGRWPEMLYPVDKALARRFPALELDADAARRLCSGQAVTGIDREINSAELARVYGPEGRFLALAAYDPIKHAWCPRKVFVSPYPGQRSVESD
ncbi:MAG: tRNA pseudouridine(55) synthase TruB [Anaerolineae bacterium]|jgi:tRNA pseudouridine55 synthase